MKRLMNITHEMHKELQCLLPRLLISHARRGRQLELLHRRSRVENRIHIILTTIDIVEHALLRRVIVGWIDKMHGGRPLVLVQESDLVGPGSCVGEETFVRVWEDGADLAGCLGGQEELGNLTRQRMT